MMQPIGPQGYAQAAPAASAVNIQIFEPKAYAPGAQPAQYNPTYAYPQQSLYAQPYMNQYQQFMPQQVAPQIAPQAQNLQQPAQQEMPTPVLTTPQTPNAVAQETPAQPAQQAAAQTTPDVQVAQPTQQDQTKVDVNALLEGLKSTDNKVQEDTITKIANYSQGDPELRNAVLTEPVMRGLIDVIKQDTSGLQGPTEAQTAALNKAATGAQLTPEEEALTKELAPKTLADKNRVISMFALALLQKNQRDEIDKYNQTQDANGQLPQLKVSDLLGYNEIENAARNSEEKEIKLAAIQALAYVARPEDKETLEPVLTPALQDSEPLIQQAASEVLANLGSNAAQGQAQAQQPEQVDLSKMSRKERKALEKAQKKAAKEAAKTPKQEKIA